MNYNRITKFIMKSDLMGVSKPSLHIAPMKQLGQNSITAHPRHPFFPSPCHRKSASPDKASAPPVLSCLWCGIMAQRHGLVELAWCCCVWQNGDLHLNDECILHHILLLILYNKCRVFRFYCVCAPFFVRFTQDLNEGNNQSIKDVNF